MVEINLLPTDIAPKGPVNKIANILKRVAIIGAAALVFSLLIAGGYIVFLSSQVNTSLDRQSQLESSIRSLEQTEQRLVLLKDRLQKARTVLAEDTATTKLEDFEEISTNLPSESRVVEAGVDTEKIEVSYLIGSSSSLAQLMANIVTLEGFEKIDLKSFSFSPSTGYLVTLEMM